MAQRNCFIRLVSAEEKGYNEKVKLFKYFKFEGGIVVKKYLMILTFMLLMFLGLSSVACGAEEEKPFRVVGYYSEALFDEPVDRLPMDKLTHIMYAFLIPNADGTVMPIEKPDQLREMVAKAHANDVAVFISVGGWSYGTEALAPRFETIAATAENRAVFIQNVLEVVQEYDLDGVELDWEYPQMTSGQVYEDLVVEMSAALAKEGKELTAALNGAWSVEDGPEVSKLVSAKCLEAFAFINVMSYDMNNDNHSPLWFADTSIGYYTVGRQMPEGKVVLGMPLYAHPSWMQYRQLVEANPQYAYVDYVPAGEVSTLESYYNGLNTLREKTALAYRKAGGVMLFDVNEDTTDEYSVLSMIDEVVKDAQAMGREAFERKVLVFVNNRPLTFKAEENMGDAFIDEHDRTLLPLRKPLEALQAEVIYHEQERTVEISKEDTVVCVTIDSSLITINGEPQEMDTQAIIRDGRTYIPARAVFEAFGCAVDWHAVSQAIYITQK